VNAWLRIGRRSSSGSPKHGGRTTAPNISRDSGGASLRRRTAAVPRHLAPRPVQIRVRSRLRGHSKSVWLVPPRRASRSVRLAVGAGRHRAVAQGRAIVPLVARLSPCCAWGAASGPSRRQAAGVTTSDTRGGVVRSRWLGVVVQADPIGSRSALARRPPPVPQCLRNLSRSNTFFLRSMWYMARPSLWARILNALPLP
jgi:hypothetical protein